MSLKPHRPRRLSVRDYARAERFMPWFLPGKFRNADVQPQWSADGKSFLYRRQTTVGWEWIVVESATGSRDQAFDHRRLAARLKKDIGVVSRSDRLPLEGVELCASGEIRFSTGGRRYAIDAACRRIEAVVEPAVGADELRSPDGRWVAFRKGFDLYIRSLVDGADRRLTEDGRHGLGYAVSPDSNCIAVAARIDGRPQLPVAIWSPDSRYLLTHRLDEMRVREVPIVQHVTRDGLPDPVVHKYRMPFSGDAELPLAELLLFDVESWQRQIVSGAPLLASMMSPIEQNLVWWSADGHAVFVLRRARAEKSIQLEVVDAVSGQSRVVMSESSATFVEASSQFWGRAITVLDSSGEVVWFSERSGWGHLYLHDLATGTLKHAITEGDWLVCELLHVDERRRFVYFTGCGREQGRDPYFRHFYRASLDGGEVELLTPEDADHTILKPRSALFVSISSANGGAIASGLSPCGRYFIDTYSTVDSAPRSVLRKSDGELVTELEACDVQPLLSLGWRWPERVVTEGRGVETPIYGVLYVPSHFDPSRKYPVIDLHYPGPHSTRVPKSSLHSDPISMWWYADGRYWAELGFVVVVLDGMGTPLRGKKFHDFSYQNMHDCGTPDRIAAIRRLAVDRPWMDLDRVGIVGHSGGGFGAARAMFDHGDFYKVGISSAGSHDLRAYANAFSEQFLGPFDPDVYAQASNLSVAERLTGKLLLCVGDMDENTHPALTLAVVAALIKANRDFDLLIYPNGDHTVIGCGYYLRRQWDYMVRHLLGAIPPKEYELWDPRSGKPPEKI